MDEGFKLRNILNIRVVCELAERIKQVYPDFDDEGFNKSIGESIDTLNFGDRSKLIRVKLKVFLPNDFVKAANILIDSLGPELVIEPGKTDWDGFINVSLADFIADNGVYHYDLSMKALYEMTKRCSSENAIRTFIREYPEKTLALLKVWTKDENVHVRRLVSEGTRPRLPLSSPLRMFQKDPGPVIELLELLKDDPELYVRRSVANNLNAISKDNPEIVVKTLKDWKKDASKERQWIIKHSLRTLFKKGDKDALELMGFLEPKIDNTRISLKPEIKIGENAIIEVKFDSLCDQKLMIDYVIHYMKSNGKQSEKVFKLAVKNAKENENINLSKKHSFRQMTTRKHYPGKHIVELVVNGKRFARHEFILQ